MTTIDRYVLDGKVPRKTIDIEEWKRKNKKSRQVAFDNIEGGVEVSTIFLGIDQGFSNLGPPVLFETRIVGGNHHLYKVRCSTWEEAVRLHEMAVTLVRTKKQV